MTSNALTTTDFKAGLLSTTGTFSGLLVTQNINNAVDMTVGGNINGLAKFTGGITVAGSPTGFTGGEIKFNPSAGLNAVAAITSFGTGTPIMVFDHRGASNTGTWLWRNGTDGSSQRMSLSADGDLQAGRMIRTGGLVGTGHESQRADAQAQMYGFGFAYACDGVAHQGGVTAGLSISVNRGTPAVAFYNPASDSIQTFGASGVKTFSVNTIGDIQLSGKLYFSNLSQAGWAGGATAGGVGLVLPSDPRGFFTVNIAGLGDVKIAVYLP